MRNVLLVVMTLALLASNPATSATTYLFWGIITESSDYYDGVDDSWNRPYEGLEVGTYFSGGLIYNPSVPYSSWMFFLAGELTDVTTADPGDRGSPPPWGNQNSSTVGFGYSYSGHRHSARNSLVLGFAAGTPVNPLPDKLDLSAFVSGYYDLHSGGYGGDFEYNQYLRGDIIEFVEAPLPASGWLFAAALMGLISRKFGTDYRVLPT